MSDTLGMSQVQAINEPPPHSWDDYERGCMLTYRGGHHDEKELRSYQHGMATVFQLLRHEFPPAEQCEAAPEMLAALQAVVAADDAAIGELRKILGDEVPMECSEVRNMCELAIANATEWSDKT